MLLVLGLLDSCVGMVCQLAGLRFGFGCSGVVVSLVVVLVGIALFVDLLASLFSICLELLIVVGELLVCCGWLILPFMVLIVLVSCYEYILCCVFWIA